MSINSMEASFFEPVKDVMFNCFCGWQGSELELDVITNIDSNLVCCPVCENDDVRVVNK